MGERKPDMNTKSTERDLPRLPASPERARRGLVKHDGCGRFFVDGVDITTLPVELYSCIWKLKDYEESGLSPDDVITLKNLYNDACETIDRLRSEIGEMKEKLFDLPVRPGDVIYDCREFFYENKVKPRIIEMRVQSVDLSRCGNGRIKFTVRSGLESLTYSGGDFGKIVFHNKSEAERVAYEKHKNNKSI